jgi:hypothetical protein
MKPTLNAAPSDRRGKPQFIPDDKEAYKAILMIWGITESDVEQLDELLFAGNDAEVIKDCNANKRRILFIYLALHSLYGRDLADEWMRLRNTNAMFAGATPLSLILSKGRKGLLDICRLLASRIV